MNLNLDTNSIKGSIVQEYREDNATEEEEEPREVMVEAEEYRVKPSFGHNWLNLLITFLLLRSNKRLQNFWLKLAIKNTFIYYIINLGYKLRNRRWILFYLLNFLLFGSTSKPWFSYSLKILRF